MAASVGLKARPIEDATQGTNLPAFLLYPAVAAERAPPLRAVRDQRRLGRARRRLRAEAGHPVAWRRRLALDPAPPGPHLARSGFVACLVEHVGNSRSDNSLDGTAAKLENRPAT